MKRSAAAGRRLTKSEQMSRVRNKDTRPEMLLRTALWRAGFRYRLRVKLPGSPDFVFLGAKVAVFVDGCFWHGCPLHYTSPVKNNIFWNAKLLRNIARDRAVEISLRDIGWTVVRIWEHEIDSDLDVAVDKVKSSLTDVS